MTKKNRREIVLHDNNHDIQKIEFSFNEISAIIDNRLLNKMNRQNKRR